MRSIFALIFSLLISFGLEAQDKERIDVRGKILVANNDREGVTVFNTSSNKGTITDSLGRFKIRVKLNDIVEVSALQFEKFTIRVDKRIVDSKQMTVFLIEEINKLDEVIILPYDLSGILETDVTSVKTFNPDLDAIYFGVEDVSAYEFGDDYKSNVRNVVMTNGIDNVIGSDLVQVAGLLVNTLFPNRKKKKKVKDWREMYPTVSNENKKDLLDYYSTQFIESSFNIPKNKIEAFIVYAETNGLDYTLLNDGKVLEFFELVRTQRELFLKSTRD